MSIILCILFLVAVQFTLSPGLAQSQGSDSLRTFIIHVHQNPASTPFTNSTDRVNWYKTFLPTAANESRLVHSYCNVVSGFAARLTDDEFVELKKKDGFVHAYPDQIYPLLTTHTPTFLGLSSNGPGFWRDSNFGKGVIIGVLDTGISPNHPSFRDSGMPPPPAKWKGVCEFNASDCNNKLIGARNLVGSLIGTTQAAPWDYEGHGTHTASTAAGAPVKNANFDGQANGTATGMAPGAHIAVYKVCRDGGCADSDILAGMDKAVEDGVDVLSISLGGASLPFYSYSIAIGAFGAVEKGVFVSCAAGNSGPTQSSLSNEAPWVLTVGAGTMDRSIRTTVTLGNNDSYNGESAYQPSGPLTATSLPLIYPGSNYSNAAFCDRPLPDIVRGKIVICDDGNVDWVQKGVFVKNASGAGMIVANYDAEGSTVFANPNVLPASQVSYIDGVKIKAYINSTSAPRASIVYKGTVTGASPAPVVPYFSSRGPSQADPNILKPDIIGPGVNILAAWPFPVGDGSGAHFNMDSGTSMATPHLSGIAALLKSSHPDWSPAAIKSAMMTTADVNAKDGKPILSQDGNNANYFAVGAGHINPTKASSPGLVYDIDSVTSYIPYLCGLNYTDKQVGAVVRRRVNCSSVLSISGSDLNYPSIVVNLTAANNYTRRVSRTVTNVGAANSTYNVKLSLPSGVAVAVAVKPYQLSFTKPGQKLQFAVEFNATNSKSFPAAGVTYLEASLSWVSSDKSVTVRSPVILAVR